MAHWAPHSPLKASREDYYALSHIERHRERIYAAMIRSLDRGGRSGDGGAGYIGLPNVNAPYRGWKSTLFEGGIRVPFPARWPWITTKATNIDRDLSQGNQPEDEFAYSLN